MSIAAEMMGLDLPEGVVYEDLDKMQEEKEAKQKEEEQARLDASLAKQEKPKEEPVKFIPNLDQLREMERWQVFSFRKLKKGESLDFPFELRALPATVGDAIKRQLLTAKTEAEIKAAFDVVTDTPAPAYSAPDYGYLLDGIRMGVEALKASNNGLVDGKQAESNQADAVATP